MKTPKCFAHRLRTITPASVFLLALLAFGSPRDASADVLELKNGNILNGRYAGGTASTVRFDTGAGVEVIETSQIVALTFTTPAAAQVPVAVPAPVVTSVAAVTPVVVVPAKPVTLQAGTPLLVRMVDGISSRNSPGTPFTTRLEYDLPSGVKAGTIMYGKVLNSTQAGRALGRSTLDLRLTQMVIGGQPVPILTSGHKEAGQASIAKAAKGAGAGAAIGAIAGDAGKGAAIGAVAGSLVKGQTITIPPGALLEFTVMQTVIIPGAQ